MLTWTFAASGVDYQGLTRGFRHGKIYCSPITAALVTMQIGVPTMYLEVVHLNRQVTIDGIRVTFLDANHCPGSVMILFELPNNDVGFPFRNLPESCCCCHCCVI